VYDEAGTATKLVGVTLDITERKMLEEELERRVRQRTIELATANENLERSNKELEQFAFVSSHDLQEPLRKIQTFAHMLYERNRDELNEQGRTYLDKMMSASKRMSKLINDLLNFSRLQRSEERFVPTDLNNILSNIENDFELLINQKQAVIHSEGLPVIEANPLEMNQLFYNLLGNALKFSKEDVSPEITLSSKRLSTEEIAENDKLIKDKEYYRIVVSDNGIGFSQQYAHKIFEIFQRLNTRSEYEGTGIGLALVHKIILNHQGIIYAESEEGVGSSFYMILPATQIKTGA
jgi:two-component system CheB/CheR fusion protein